MTKRGHAEPIRDNSAGNIFSQPNETPELPLHGPALPEPIKPVDEIMAEHKVLEDQKAERRAQLEAANWQQPQIDIQLDEEFPALVSGETLERRHQQEDANARHTAMMAGGDHPTGPRGKRYHFDNDDARVDSDQYQN
jgi:hypothetical protein